MNRTTELAVQAALVALRQDDDTLDDEERWQATDTKAALQQLLQTTNPAFEAELVAYSGPSLLTDTERAVVSLAYLALDVAYERNLDALNAGELANSDDTDVEFAVESLHSVSHHLGELS